MTLFYINSEYKSPERFDPGKFMEFVNGGYDVLTSYVFNKIKELPIAGTYKVISAKSNPPLLSYRIYGDIQYWYLLLLYNDIIDFRNIQIGDVINFFDLSDLEDLFFSLKSKQVQLNIEEAISLSTSEIITGVPAVAGNIVNSLLPPSDITDGWRKEGTNTIFVYDSGRGKWLQSGHAKQEVARSFDTVSNQYLFSVDGQSTILAPIIFPFDATITQVIIQSAETSSYIIELRDITEEVIDGGSISVESTKIYNDDSLDIDVAKNTEIAAYLNGTGINNPRVSIFYKERG